MSTKKSWKAWLGQGVLYGLFATFIAVFAHWPTYHPLGPDEAVLKVSFIHHGDRVEPCRPYTKEEQAGLPIHMRTPMKCGRERVPVAIEVELDGRTILSQVAPPSGLSRDGASAVYHRLDLPAGEHRLVVRMRDKPGGAFNHTREAKLKLRPAQVLVIDFDPEKGGITFI